MTKNLQNKLEKILHSVEKKVIHKSKKRTQCLEKNCNTLASFTIVEGNIPILCIKHKKPNMVNKYHHKRRFINKKNSPKNIIEKIEYLEKYLEDNESHSDNELSDLESDDDNLPDLESDQDFIKSIKDLEIDDVLAKQIEEIYKEWFCDNTVVSENTKNTDIVFFYKCCDALYVPAEEIQDILFQNYIDTLPTYEEMFEKYINY